MSKYGGKKKSILTSGRPRLEEQEKKVTIPQSEVEIYAFYYDAEIVVIQNTEHSL